MRRAAGWKHWVVFALITSCVSMAAYHLGSLAAIELKQHEQKTPLPTVNGLYIEPQALDIGEAWETPEYRFPLKIRNAGRVSRTIRRFQTTCGCLELDPPGRIIEPGETAEFTGKLNLMHRLPYQWGIAQWPVSVRLDPVFDGDLGSTPGWEVKGVARCRVSINTPKLAFDERCSPEGSRVWQKVHAKAYVPLKELRAAATSKTAEVRVEKSATDPADYFIFVSPNASLPLGRFRLEVQLQAMTLDDVVHPCPTIEVLGDMQPSSRLIPRMVLLGEHTVPSEAEADVTLRLPGKDWKIAHIEADTTGVRIKRSKSELEEEVRLHITQRIKQAGDHVSTIRIVVRRPDKKLEIVPVEVRYYGQSGPR